MTGRCCQRCALSAAADRPAAKAWLQFELGEMDAGFANLARAIEEHDPAVIFLLSWRGFAELRSDERYSGVLRQLSLTDYERVWRGRSG